MQKWLLLPLALLLVGCGSSDTTVVRDAQGNEVRTSQDGDEVTVKDDKGIEYKADDNSFEIKDEKGETVQTGSTEISESELGLPFYPKSEAAEYGNMTSDSKEGKIFVSMRTTADSVRDVLDFYKPKISNPQEFATTTSNTDTATLTGKLGDAQVGIVATRENGKKETTIAITVTRLKG